MVTCFRVGSNKPTQRLNFHVSSVSPLPKTYRDAFHDSNWQNAMRDEYDALIKNSTWTLVPRLPNANVVRCMWLFWHKFLADGTLSRYKARLVANGSTQLEGVDVDETFCPIVKPGTIHMVLSLAVSRHWPIHQQDVKNVFLHGDLTETVYMHQPPGFRDSTVLALTLSLWAQASSPSMVSAELDTAYLLLYVDDIVLTASSSELLQRIIRSLHQEFAMTDLGPLNYFLGVSVTHDSSGLFLSQQKYAVEILEKAHMLNCNPSRTPIDTESKLGVGVQQVCLHMHDPREPHLSALKRILRYVQGNMNCSLQLFSSSTTDLVAYSDADWAGCPTTRRSTSGYCVFLGNNLLSWSSKRQPTLSRSTAEVEYRGVTNVVAETCWLRNLLRELHTPLSSATLVYCDNVSAVYLSCNLVQHQRTKHIEIDIHFVRDLVAAGQVHVLHVPSRYQFADNFTKGLPSALFEEFRSSLSSLGSPKAFNMSLLLKWRWRLFQNPNALWIHVVKAIHGDEAGIDLSGCKTKGVWASIVGSINHLHSSCIVPLNSIRFKDWSRPVTAGRTKAEFDDLILDIASIEPDDLGVLILAFKMLIPFLPVTLPLLFGALCVHGLVLFSHPFPLVASGILGFSHGTLPKKRRSALTSSLQLLVGPFGVIEIVSHSTLFP
ncbi:ribonuclease H-like domain-containing protein [Tanacetum coccineum]